MRLNNLHQKKLFLNDLLSRELYNCDYVINAYYESSAGNRVADISVGRGSVIRLGINVPYRSMDVFCGHSDPMLMTLIFRSYYITGLIRCLEGASKALPDSYLMGLVTLESVITLNRGKRSEFFIPNIRGKNKQLCVIDAYCAKLAMTRIMTEHRDSLSAEVMHTCRVYTDNLISYTLLPEIEYRKGGRACFSSLRVMIELRQLLSKHPDITRSYAVFSGGGIESLDVSIAELGDRFWQQMVFRLTVLSGTEGIRYSDDFDRSSVEYRLTMDRDSILLNENWNAIKILSGKAQGLATDRDRQISPRVRRIR